jgi:tetraacyldisaccharide 4'-kinase
VYALGLAFVTGLPTMYVGTAKSVYVAPYGPFERTLLRRALRIFVRDEPTAARLREQGVAAQAPGNVIVDLARSDDPGDAGEGSCIGVLPGSRSDAYRNAVRLARVIRALAGRVPARGMLSIAPTLEATHFARELAADGWTIEPAGAQRAFVARADGAVLHGSNGDLGRLLARATVVVGQAGTANEQAAACGVPVIALDDPAESGWYRMRQRRLLGDALAIVPGDPHAAAAAIAALLADPARLAAMARAGRERMGPAGGSAAIARAIVAFG